MYWIMYPINWFENITEVILSLPLAFRHPREHQPKLDQIADHFLVSLTCQVNKPPPELSSSVLIAIMFTVNRLLN